LYNIQLKRRDIIKIHGRIACSWRIILKNLENLLLSSLPSEDQCSLDDDGVAAADATLVRADGRSIIGDVADKY